MRSRIRPASLKSPGMPQYVVSSDVDRAIDGSICFQRSPATPIGAPQVAFARVVTDKATFAWVCDVFVLPEHRGCGKAAHGRGDVASRPAGLRNVLLATRDAHGLYARYGFAPLAEPPGWMAIRRSYRA